MGMDAWVTVMVIGFLGLSGAGALGFPFGISPLLMSVFLIVVVGIGWGFSQVYGDSSFVVIAVVFCFFINFFIYLFFY